VNVPGLWQAKHLLADLQSLLSSVGEGIHWTRAAGLRRDPGVPPKLDDGRGRKSLEEAYDETERWEFWRK
jgi:hypothetical protein